MKFELHYGKGKLSLQIPEKNIAQIVRPWQKAPVGRRTDETWVSKALQCDEARRFEHIIAGKRLCVLTEDGTRDGPFAEVFKQLFGLLRPSSQVLFIISTGTHDADTGENNAIREEIEKAANAANLHNFRIHTNDCRQDGFINAGRTCRGTGVLFNDEVAETDVFLALSDMKTHYFSGYSNAIKNFVPGVCAFKTAEQNHRLALDENSTFGLHPWHSNQDRRANPCAADQLEGMRLLIKERPVYALATISTSQQVQWANFGHIEPVTRAGFDIIDKCNTHTVKPVPRLIVSPGGFPNDTNLYIAQRALELTKYAVSDGGEILFLSACANGIGEQGTLENFYNLLTHPLEEVLESIKSEYRMYSHKPYKFAQLISRLRRIWIHSQISDELIEPAHLHPAHQPQAIVDQWLGEDADTRIMAVDGANKIALYASPADGRLA